MSKRDLIDLGNGDWAYLQDKGTWGRSNAGLITDGGASVLVDTLFDLHLTRDMLEQMAKATPAAHRIRLLINSHSDGDHTFGNQLLRAVPILTSHRTATEMAMSGPEAMRGMMERTRQMGITGAFLDRAFSTFDFNGVELTLPTSTFDREASLMVGNKEIRLLEVGPAHTLGDTLIYVPGDRVVYAGDILFIGVHPVIWTGPTENWLRALDLILEMDVKTIVPGHGPLTDKDHVRALRDYFEYLQREARSRYMDGMTAFQAAEEIANENGPVWENPERIVVNVMAMYREFSGDESIPTRLDSFAAMATFDYQRRR